MAGNNHNNNNSNNQKEPPIKKFPLGTKELDDKTCEFLYDNGTYIINDINGETRSEVYRSRNMQEAYTKWNVYIGRKKERPSRVRSEETEETRPSENTVSRDKDRDRNRDKERENNRPDNHQKKKTESGFDGNENKPQKSGQNKHRNRHRGHKGGGNQKPKPQA